MPVGYDQVFETQSHCNLFATFQIKVAHTSICLSKSLVFCSDAWLLYWQKALDNAFRQAVASKDISSCCKESLVSHNQRKSPDPGRFRLEIITTVLSSTNKVRAGKLSFQIFVHKLYASIVSIDCWTTSTQRWLGPVVWTEYIYNLFINSIFVRARCSKDPVIWMVDSDTKAIIARANFTTGKKRVEHYAPIINYLAIISILWGTKCKPRWYEENGCNRSLRYCAPVYSNLVPIAVRTLQTPEIAS